MAVKRKIIEIDEEKCNGCGQCVIACAEGAIEIVDGKAKVISDDLCDGLGACIGECPEDALHIIEREADEFDEEAVEKHLAAMKEKEANKEEKTMACGCPSTQIQSIMPTTPCQAANKPASMVSGGSELTNWPVQIRLIPPTAPFLKKADLLVAADCVPVAFPTLHSHFLKGKTVMIGCPKFDDAESYVQKFVEIFQTANINSITCLAMEVPCCAGLPAIVIKAMEEAGVDIPFERVVVSARGEIVERVGLKKSA